MKSQAVVYLQINENGRARRIFLEKLPAWLGRSRAGKLTPQKKPFANSVLKIFARGRIVIVKQFGTQQDFRLNGENFTSNTLRSGDRLTSEHIELMAFVLKSTAITGNRIGDLFHGHPKRSSFSSTLLEEAEASIIFEKNNHDVSWINKTPMQRSLSETTALIHDTAKKFLPHPFILTLLEVSPDLGRIHILDSTKTNPLLKFNTLSEPHIYIGIAKKKSIGFATTNNTSLVIPVCATNRKFIVLYLEAHIPGGTIPTHSIKSMIENLSRISPLVEIDTLRRELHSSSLAIIRTVISALEAKDAYTVGHSHRVSFYSLAIAEILKLDHETKQNLMISALCHDVGKIGIRESILNKPSTLNPVEISEMQKHPDIGAQIVAQIPNSEKFMLGVRHHHEKWDGSGYPDGLKGEMIPFFARIIAVADFFDALVSSRPYSPEKLSTKDAFEIIRDTRGRFDPEIVTAFGQAIERGVIANPSSESFGFSEPKSGK